jgi:hypothetical protein
MNAGRRIAAAVLAAALSMGALGFTAGPAQARDTTWPTGITSDGGSSFTDTTWPTFADTTWPTFTDTTWPTLTDTTWPTG